MTGLFIGSFNPVTIAHIQICLRLKFDFKKIVLVPVSSKDKELIDINSRIDMLNILKNKYHFLEISDIMKKYSYVNYRIIDLLKQEYGELNIIMGSDLLEKFNKFDNYEYLLDNYSFTVIPRDNSNVDKIINNNFSKYKNKFKILDYHSDISSTLVKELLKKKQSMIDVLDSDVLKYIQDNHLYCNM